MIPGAVAALKPRRFRLRGLEKVNAEALMTASGQNVKRLVSFGPRGPKNHPDA